MELGAIDIQTAGQVYQGVSLPTSVETEYEEESVGLRGDSVNENLEDEVRFIDNHTAGERERSVLKVRADVTHLWRYASHNWWSMICNTREILLLSNLSTATLLVTLHQVNQGSPPSWYSPDTFQGNSLIRGVSVIEKDRM